MSQNVDLLGIWKDQLVDGYISGLGEWIGRYRLVDK